MTTVYYIEARIVDRLWDWVLLKIMFLMLSTVILILTMPGVCIGFDQRSLVEQVVFFKELKVPFFYQDRLKISWHRFDKFRKTNFIEFSSLAFLLFDWSYGRNLQGRLLMIRVYLLFNLLNLAHFQTSMVVWL